MKKLGWGKNNLEVNRQSHIFATDRFVTFVKLQTTEMTQKPLQEQKSFKIQCKVLQFCRFVPLFCFAKSGGQFLAKFCDIERTFFP